MSRGDNKPYKSITVEPVTPVIGAEVTDIDLADPTPVQVEEVHDALMAHQVIFFRD